MLALYQRCITQYRLLTLLLIAVITAFFASYLPHFHLDASSDSLVLQGNENLAYYQEIKKRYGSDQYLVITLNPHEGTILSEENLAHLRRVKKDLLALERVVSITSILDVPLIQSPPLSLNDVTSGPVISLENENYASKETVLQELKKHPIYHQLLVSNDLSATSLLVHFNQATEDDIAVVRSYLDPLRSHADIYIGGVPMIVADSMAYIRHDIRLFGVGVVLFIIVILSLSFFKLRWVIIPLATSSLSCLLMIGMLGFFNWPVTVVSSNFISLLLIISISLSIHLIVRYEELLEDYSMTSHDQLIIAMLREKFQPCFYTALTTIVAFSSLVIADVKPIVDFGWMMVLGVVISFLLTFTFMPALLGLFSFQRASTHMRFHEAITHLFYRAASEYRGVCLLIFVLIFIASIVGISQLSVNNRFIDYYKENTDIYQGMKVIDTEFGGTTPLEVIIDAPSDYVADEFSDGKDYWYNAFAIEEDVVAIHQYLNSLEMTGKMLSLASTVTLLRQLNDNQIDTFLLSLIREKLSPELKAILIDPYLSEDGNQIRFLTRIYESQKGINREALLHNIRNDLKEKFNLHDEQIHLTGMVVLYNDLLQSLFRSQILTVGAVFFAIAMMFLLLFRSLKLAIVAIIPNIVAAAAVLGLMGLLGISLNIMTITIAAISLGIAVDDTIHYVHRFRRENKRGDGSWNAIKRSHHTVGRALYLTTATITLGFSILAFSNFVPTVHFGLHTGFSMIIALLADLILLPILLRFAYRN